MNTITEIEKPLIKEYPILFSTPMVQAIIEGRKTQTRRIVNRTALKWIDEAGFTPEFVALPENHLCRYGYPGDKLWVRETWNSYNKNFYGLPDEEVYLYKANGTDRTCTWKPSIFMPKAACRIFLQIENIRIERLQDISEENAKAEGIELVEKEHGIFPYYKDYSEHPNDFVFESPKDSYKSLWEKINGINSWNQNPFVWVIEFKRIEK